jgi:hypothetical protein
MALQFLKTKIDRTNQTNTYDELIQIFMLAMFLRAYWGERRENGTT